MILNPSKNNELFARKSIRNALKVWRKPEKLGEHDLANLKIVDVRRREEGYPDTSEGYGAALRGVLRETIESLKPEGQKATPLTRDWGSYIIVTEQYVANRQRMYVEDTWEIPRDTYSKWQRRALDQVANSLQEQELELGAQEQVEAQEEQQTQKALSERDVPFMPPPLPSYALIGRDQTLADLRRRLFAGDAPSMALFALKGLPGVGKTALAITLAHDSQVQAHFADGVLWAGLGREPDLLALLSSWGIALGIPAGEMGKLLTIEDRARAIHAAIGKRRILLVIDDAWQIKDALAFKLGGPNCAHILTTRLPELAWEFAEEGAKAVQELNESDSLALLSEFVPQLVIAYPEEAKELVNVVGGLPLALILIGRYVRKALRLGQQNVLADVLAQLQQAQTRLSLSMPQSPLEKQPSLRYGVPLSLLASIEVSDKALDEVARQMLRASSLFPPKPNSFSEEAALAVANKPAQTLQTLIEAGLLERSGPSRYTLHQAIAEYARLKNPEPDNGYRRGASYFAEFALQHSQSDGYPLLDGDWQNVSHFLQWAYEKQAWQTLVDGVEGLTRMNLGIVGFMDARGHWVQVKQLLEKALEGAKALNDPQREGSILSKLGAFAFRQANFEEAAPYLLQSLSILSLFPSLPKLTLQRTDNYEFLARLEMRHDLEAAHEWIEKGLSELDGLSIKTDGVIHQKGYFYVLLATLNGRMGRFPTAITAAEKGLALLPPGATAAKVSAFTTLGTIFYHRAETDKSIEYVKKGIKIAEELGDSRRLANLWTNIGINERQRANFSLALASYQKALPLYQRMGYRHAEGRVYNNLGMIYLIRGEDELAVGCFTTALEMAKENKIIQLEAFARTNLAHLQIYRGQLAEATSLLSRGHEITLQLELTSLLPGILYWQAEIARLNKEHDKAQALISKSLSVAQKAGYVVAEGVGWSIQGKILDAQQRFDEAEAAHQSSLQLLNGQDLYDLAHSQLAFGEHYMIRDGQISERAKSLLLNALESFARLGAQREIAMIKSLLNANRS